MLVSIVIPTFNRAKTIESAIESVIAQTHSETEIIVVDDGSTDATVAILARYSRHINLICQKNAGPSAARNTGIRASSGEIVAFLDSDDNWHPEKIARQLELMQRDGSAPLGCCVCNAEMRFQGGRTTTSFRVAGLNPRMAEGIWVNPTAVLATRFLLFNQVAAIRRSTLDKVGFFNEDLRIMEDYDLALRVSLDAPWGFISEPLATWNGGSEGSLTTPAKSREINQKAYLILSNLLCTFEIDLSLQSIIRRRLSTLKAQNKALELSDRHGRLSRRSGTIFLKWLRVREAFRQRLPSFPKMETKP